MVNSLHDAIVAGKGKEVLGPTLTELATYTIQHFKDEEGLMTSINYPALAAHKRKHEDLTAKVKELIAKFQDGKMVLSVTLSAFLSDWLRHHIKEDDAALIKYTREHGLVAKPVGAGR